MLPAVPAHAGASTLKPGKNVVARSADGLTDGEGSVTLVIPAIKGPAVYLGLQLRTKGNGSAYRARLKVERDGDMYVGFSRNIRSRDTRLTSVKIPGKARAGQRVVLNGSVSGSAPVRLAVRAWVEGKPQPGWQKTYVDSSRKRVTGWGRVGVWGYLSKSAKANARFRYTKLSGTPARAAVAPPQAAPRPPVPVPTVPKPTVPTPTVPTPTPTVPTPTVPTPTVPTPTVPTPTVPTPTDPAPTGEKPSAATTGVPAGTQLTRHNGDIVVTQDGAHLDRMDIYGFVDIKAKNVKITNSRIHGGTATNNRGLVTNYGFDNLLIADTDIDADTQSVWVDGIKGWDFTARRVHVVGGVDSIKIHGDNVTVEDSLLENTNYFASDPNQGGGATHNDNIQILVGTNLSIARNTIRGPGTHTILAGAHQGNAQVSVVGNWLDGAICNVKMQSKSTWALNAVVKDNKFGPNRVYQKCMISQQTTGNITVALGGNVLENSPFSPVPVFME
jgi:hypothetical protein